MTEAIHLLARTHRGYQVPFEDLTSTEVHWLNDEGFIRYTLDGVEITAIGAIRAPQYENRSSGRSK